MGGGFLWVYPWRYVLAKVVLLQKFEERLEVVYYVRLVVLCLSLVVYF